MIQSFDKTSQSAVSRLNFKGNENQNSLLGAFCTITVYFFFLLIAGVKLSEIITKEKIYSVNVPKPYKLNGDFEKIINLKTSSYLPKILYKIQDYKRNYLLDKSKIILAADNAFFKWDETTQTFSESHIFKYPHLCTESDFTKTEFEKLFWQENKGNLFYCLDGEDLLLQGTRSSFAHQTDSSYIMYKYFRCHNDLRRKNENGELISEADGGDPECSTEEEIDKWTELKTGRMHLLNILAQTDVNSNTMTSQSEIWLQPVTIKAGTYTDQGFRFRKNTIRKINHVWWPFFKSAVFFDYKFFSHDEFTIDKNDPTKNNHLISESWFRISDEEILFEVKVQGLAELLGQLGGLDLLLLSWVGLFISGLQKTYLSLQIIKRLYKVKTKEYQYPIVKGNKQCSYPYQILELSWFKMFKIHLLYFSWFSFLYQKVKTFTKDDLQYNFMVKGENKIGHDFDICQIIHSVRKLKFESKIIKEKLGMRDKMFDFENPEEIIYNDREKFKKQSHWKDQFKEIITNEPTFMSNHDSINNEQEIKQIKQMIPLVLHTHKHKQKFHESIKSNQNYENKPIFYESIQFNHKTENIKDL